MIYITGQSLPVENAIFKPNIFAISFITSPLLWGGRGQFCHTMLSKSVGLVSLVGVVSLWDPQISKSSRFGDGH